MFIHVGMPVRSPGQELTLIRQMKTVLDTAHISDSDMIYMGVDFWRSTMAMQFQLSNITDKQITTILLLMPNLTIFYDSRSESEE